MIGTGIGLTQVAARRKDAAATLFSFSDNFDSGSNGDTVARRTGWTVRSDDGRLAPFVQAQGFVQVDGFSPSNYGFAGVDVGRVDGCFAQAKFLGASSSTNGLGFYYDKDNWIRMTLNSANRLQIVERVSGVNTTRFDTASFLASTMVAGDVFKLILTYSGTSPRLTIQRNGVNFPQQSDYSAGTAPTFPLTALTLSLPLGLSGFIGATGPSGSPNWDDFAAGHNGVTPLPRLAMAKSVRLYQRGATTGTRSVPVGGDAVSVTGVEMRLLQSGSVVSGWDWGQKALTNVSIAGGKWFADTAQIPGGDSYVIEVRATNDNSALCRTRTFAIGDIIIAGGQSNGTGLATATPISGGTVVGPAGGYAAGGVLASSAGGNDVGAYIYPPDVQFSTPSQSSMTGSNAAALHAGLRAGSPDVPTMTVPFGLGSSNLVRFLPSSTDHTAVVGAMSLWEGLMSQLNALYDPTGRDTTAVDYAGIIWLQGEDDAGRSLGSLSFDAAAETAHRANLVIFYGAHKTATGRTAAQLPVSLIGLNRVYTTSSASQAASPAWTRFRAMQWDVCDPASAGYIPGFFYAGSNMDIKLQDTSSAQVHYSSPEQIEKSYRAGYAMARAKGWATKDRRGAIPLSAVVSGNTIIVTFDLQLATSLTCSASVSSQYLFATSNAVDSTTGLLVAANQKVPTAMSIGTPSGGQCTVTYTFATAPAAGWAMQLYGGVNPQNIQAKDPNALYSVMPTDAGAGTSVLSVGAFYPLVAT